MATMVCDLKDREPASVKIRCSRCPFKGTAGEGVQIITGADGAKMPYCLKCGGPCCEEQEEVSHEPAKH